MSGRVQDFQSIGALPRPQQAAVCFGLGKAAIPWSPLRSADEYEICNPGRRDSRYRSNHSALGYIV
jgi:hypothetical protein